MPIFYDSGVVTLTIGGVAKSVNYTQVSTPASAFDSQASSLVIGGHDTHSPCDCHACLGWLVSCFGACPSCDAAGESA
jgi:hypothetical protein